VKRLNWGYFGALTAPRATRILAAYLISILILIAGVPGIGAASAAGGAEEGTVPGVMDRAADAAVNGTADTAVNGTAVTVTRAGETLRYELAVAPDASVDRLWMVVGGGTVVESPGFERVENDGRTRLTWTGAESARVVLAVRAPRQGAADGPAGRESVATASWTFASVPFVELQRVADGEVERSWPLTERAGNLADAQGVYGERYALAGPTDVVTRSNAGRDVSVVVPADATPAEDPAVIADALADAAGRLDVGDRDEAVLAYAVPGVRRGGESVPARDEFWVEAGSRLDDPESVWLHEYVHTRQSYRPAEDMRWFREASAEYYAARLSYEQGSVSERALRRHLDGDPSRATLTDPATWTSDGVPHHRGARVLAVLDAKIRAETGGHRSLEDVFRRVNRHDGTVTYADFAQTVNEVAGTSMDGWLDRHVAGDAPVSDQYPSDSGVVEGALGTGLSQLFSPSASPALTFLLVSVGLSVVAAPPLYRVLDRLDRRQGDHDGDRSTWRPERPR
jgi:hypothetical protein